MLLTVHPKLPMRDKAATLAYYVRLGFQQVGGEHAEYLMLVKSRVEIHFFLFPGLQPTENYGQVYIRTGDIDGLYKELLDAGIAIHPNGKLQTRPWGQREFSLLDPDHNLLTFGQSI